VRRGADFKTASLKGNKKKRTPKTTLHRGPLRAEECYERFTKSERRNEEVGEKATTRARTTRYPR